MASGSPAEAQAWLQYLTGPVTSGPGQERARNGHPQPYEVPFVGIGNETWGCGGNMTAEYYSDLYRQYVSVLKRPRVTLVAADANSDDYAWTETLLSRALYRHAVSTPLAYISKNPQISMLSVHFYTFAGNDWGKKSSATGFSENDWALALERTQKMDELVARHSRHPGPPRPGASHRPVHQRMGHLVGHRERPPVEPLPDHHLARRRDRGTHAQHLPEPVRARAHGQHRADGQRAAGA